MKKEIRTYLGRRVGRRVGRKEHLVYAWRVDAYPGDGKVYNHDEQPITAAIGSRWEFSVDDSGAYYVKGPFEPIFIGQLEGEQVIQWDAADRSAAATTHV